MTKAETPDVSSMQAQAQQQHQWLKKFLGEWTFEGEASMPGEPATKFSGSERVRALGDLWIIAESSGQMPDGGTAEMVMTLGYDPQRKGYVGTWVSSTMTYMWVYSGTLDTTGKCLILESTGPNMSSPGTMMRSQDIIEFESDDHRIMRSQMLGDDGQWYPMMEIHFRKKA
ncbi:MAG: DUF1579 domain-containing protein [Thiohalomonadaceae bacterium]